MFYKKFLSIIFIFVFNFQFCLAIEDNKAPLNGSFSKISLKAIKKENGGKYKTVLKKYTPYFLEVTNSGDKPVLLNAKSEIIYTDDSGKSIVSEDRRTIYRKVRKKDIGRYYSFALPGAIIAGGITGITFFLGAPIGAAICIGAYAPTDKAVRTNVKVAQNLYKTYDLPLVFEPGQSYKILLFAPNSYFKEITITNLSYDLKNLFNSSFCEKTETAGHFGVKTVEAKKSEGKNE